MQFAGLIGLVGGISGVYGHFGGISWLMYVGLCLLLVDFVLDRLAGLPLPFVEAIAVAIAKGVGLDWLPAIAVGYGIVAAFGNVFVVLGSLGSGAAKVDGGG